MGAGVRRGSALEVLRNIPGPTFIRIGGALRGACRARPMSVYGGPLVMACMLYDALGMHPSFLDGV